MLASESLGALIGEGKLPADEILVRFVDWTRARGLELYPAQEEAVLELMDQRHVVLATPTGSGKSLVALALQYKALCEGKRCFYTSPIKALVNEKFFDLCRVLGAERVGMMTGDAAVNAGAPIVCCTAEVLANLALREGAYAPLDAVVMDEFHFYSDPERGVAWQIPLLTLPQAQFLLMSATLGDVSAFSAGLQRLTGKDTAVVRSRDRPVPLVWQYADAPIFETIRDLVQRERAPIYVADFTQRECTERAQSLTSANLCSREQKQAIAAITAEARFDTRFGKDMKRLLSHGVGLHHAGLLPKYRTLVERLAQAGLLPVICGTDTLGVGINVPIRTVVFAKLCKYDGEKTRILSVRDFHQIAGRAGRKGFDSLGWVVVQAPEHVIENRRMEMKAAAAGKKKFTRKKPPEFGYVPWDASTFEKLRDGEPEALESRFEVTHGMLLDVLDREYNVAQPHGGYRRLVDIIARSYERSGGKKRHRRHAAVLFRSLRTAGIIEVGRPGNWPRACVRVDPRLQRDFSLHHTLSLWLLDALAQLPREDATFALDVLSLVEAVLENPAQVLKQQLSKARDDAMARMRAEGAEYEERMAELERVDIPKPQAELIYRTFDEFRVVHPWVRSDNVRPKSIARDMVERWATFNDYVAEYGLQRSEGVLLRYLSQAYRTLAGNVPVSYHDEALLEIIAFLRATLARVDSSLVREWERLASGAQADAPAGPKVLDLRADPRVLAARVRAELYAFVKAIANGDLEEALACLRHDAEDAWTPERLEAALAGVRADLGKIEFSVEARRHALTRIEDDGEGRHRVEHTLVGSEGPSPWRIEAEVDIGRGELPDGPLLALRRIVD